MHHQFFTRGKLGLSIFVSGFVILVFLSACQPQPPEPTSAPPAPATASFTATPLPPASPTPTSPSAPVQTTAPTALVTETSPQPAIETSQASPSPTDTSENSASSLSASTSPVSSSSAEPSAAACTDKAAFYGDVTIPDDTGFEQAASFTKTWRFRNEGDCTWDSNYAIVFSGGEILNAPLVNPLAASIAPGQIAELSLEMRTPDRGGVFRGYWEFQNAQGARFGTGAGGHDPFWVQVVVSWMPPGGGSPPGGGAASGGSPGGSQANPGGGSAGSVGGSGGAANPSPTETPPTGGDSSGGEANPSPTSPAGGAPTSTPDPGQGQSSLPGVPAGCNARDNNGYVQALLNLINRARRDNNLEELAPSAPLYAAAAVHSADMACNNFINHIGSDGSSWYTRIAAQGYAYSVALENIVVGNPDFGGNAQYAFDWWMNSQVHRDNILNPKVRELGLGYVYNPDSEYGGYFTLVLARP